MCYSGKHSRHQTHRTYRVTVGAVRLVFAGGNPVLSRVEVCLSRCSQPTLTDSECVCVVSVLLGDAWDWDGWQMREAVE